MDTNRREGLTVAGRHVGPEVQSGHIMGRVLAGPVLVLKSCNGHRRLGWAMAELLKGVG